MVEYRNTHGYKKITSNMDDNQKKIFDHFVLKFREVYGKSNFNKKYEIYCDIIRNNIGADVDMLFVKYMSLNSNSYDAIEIRHGNEFLKKYKHALKKRPSYDRKNLYDVDIVADHYSVDASVAKQIIDERKIKASESLKSSHANKKTSGYDYRKDNPLCREYWDCRHEKSVAFELHKKHLELYAVPNSLMGYSDKYGVVDGQDKYNEYLLKRKATLLSKYGSSIPPALTNKVSKESVNYFMPLYKYCIEELNIPNSEIYWGGVADSKEYHIYHKGKNYSYDFTIKSLKYVIEYNGSLWHPRDGVVFKGFINEEKARQKDIMKKKLMEVDRGFDFRVVWDFEKYDVSIMDKFKQEIKEKYLHAFG